MKPVIRETNFLGLFLQMPLFLSGRTTTTFKFVREVHKTLLFIQLMVFPTGAEVSALPEGITA